MKVLVATADSQASDEGDYCEALEGELVRLVIRPGHEDCACSRTFLGLASGKATTTATVVERDIPGDVYEDLLHDALVRAGEPAVSATRLRAARVSGEMLRLAASFGEGMVVYRSTAVTVENRT